VPVVLGPDGIAQVVELPLSPDELAGLQAAAKKTMELIRMVHK
jgi:malate/lactate dehydrogenase